MKLPKQTPHEITLFAMTRDKETGAWAILDIVETSFHNATYFARRFRNYDGIAGIAATSPKYRGPLNVREYS